MAQPTEEERLLAALAHAAIIANVANLAGLIGASVILATQRERSSFVRAHAMQAVAFQCLALVATVALLLVWGGCVAAALLPAMLRPDLHHSGPPALFWPALLAVCAPLAFSLAAALLGLYGAAQALAGRPFRYPLLGRLARVPAATTAADGEQMGNEQN